ncbi:MAG: DJ-1/PfpI family protein [Thermodesulfobacteriota bacterium]
MKRKLLGLARTAALLGAALLALTAPASAGTLSGKKILLVVAPSNFQDREYLTCRDIFEADGASVSVAGINLEEARGMSGTRISPDLALKDVDPTKYDAVVFIGGPGATMYWDHAEARRIALAASESNKVVGAICLAPVIVARAGVLSGKDCTVWPDANREMSEAGCNYKKKDVVVAGKVITANGPDAAADFARAVEKALGK